MKALRALVTAAALAVTSASGVAHAGEGHVNAIYSPAALDAPILLAQAESEPAPAPELSDPVEPVGAEVPAEVPAAEIDIGEATESLRTAWEVGGWVGAAGALVVILVVLGRPRLARWVEWFETALGGYVLTAALAFATQLGTVAATGGDLSWGVVGGALTMALSIALTPGQDDRTARQAAQMRSSGRSLR